MTNELEKTFLDTFGIEPKCHCGNHYVFEAMLEDECTDSNREKCKTCKEVRKTYPQITDHILLELMCILSEWRTYLHSSYTIKANNTLDLKQDVLKDFLELFNWYEFKKCSEGVKQEVRTLFEEAENE